MKQSHRTAVSGFGSNLKALRKRQGWTLADVAKKTGISTGTLSKLENGLIQIRFETLMRLCDALDLSLDHLTNLPTQSSGQGIRAITRKSEGVRVESPEMIYRLHSTEILRKQLFPCVITVTARSVDEYDEWSQHDGEEFVYVLQGKLRVYTEIYEAFDLSEGDSAHYDSSMRHAFVTTSDEPCIVLSVSLGQPGQESNLVAGGMKTN